MGGPLGPHADRNAGPPKGLAARIVKARLALGLSQEKAAAEMGVRRETLARWECGEEPKPGPYRQVLDSWLRGKR